MGDSRRKVIKINRPELPRVPARQGSEARESPALYDAEYPVTGMGILLAAPAYRFEIPDDILRESHDLSATTAAMMSRALDGLEAKVLDAARSAWADGMDFAVSIGTEIRDDSRATFPSFTMTLSKAGGPVPKGTAAGAGFVILRPPPEG